MKNIKKEDFKDFFSRNNSVVNNEVFVENHSTLDFLFDIQPLSEKEELFIDSIFFDGNSSKIEKYSINQDIFLLKQITSQIKAIRKQSVIVLGERIFKAREIIQKLSNAETKFTDWLKSTFSSVSSAYNSLSYYEFFLSLPSDSLKECLFSIPYKTAYTLSSKKVENDQKHKLLPCLVGLSNGDALKVLQETFSFKDEKTKKTMQKENILKKLRIIQTEIISKMNSFSKKDKEDIQGSIKKILRLF